MAERDDDVGAFLLHLGDPGAGGLQDVAGLDVAFEVAAVPVHDLGRDEADEADPDGMGGAGAIGQGAVENDIGRDQRGIGGGGGAHRLDHVGGDDRELRAGERFGQEVETVVEFVVAEGRGLDPDGVHRGDDGVHVAVFHPAFVGDVIAHRVALQEVPVVEENRVGGLRPNGAHDGGGARKADGIDGLVGVIVVGKDVHVQIGRFHQAKVGLVGAGADREGMQCDQAGAAGEEAAAIEDKWHGGDPRKHVIREKRNMGP